MYRLSTMALACALSSLSLPALAQGGDLDVSANVTIVTDYRFRGISLSDEAPAIQGGFDVAVPSGLYAGVWASTIDSTAGAESEFDLYGGYVFDWRRFDVDVGALAYLYPDGDDLNYGELYGSLATEVDFAEVAAGLAYAWDQDNIGDDNIYVYGEAAAPLADTRFDVTASLGLTTGAFDLGEDILFDWSLGVSTEISGVDVGVSYIDTSSDVDGADSSLVASVGKAF